MRYHSLKKAKKLKSGDPASVDVTDDEEEDRHDDDWIFYDCLKFLSSNKPKRRYSLIFRYAIVCTYFLREKNNVTYIL